MGVEGGIAKAIAQMDKLHALLSEKHIGLSVSVYPWPQQLSQSFPISLRLQARTSGLSPAVILLGRPSLQLIRQRDHRARPHRPILPLIEEERVWVTALVGATGIEPVTPTMST